MEGTFVITPEGIIPKTNAMVGFIREISTKEELVELMERMPYITTISAPNRKVRRELYDMAMEKYEDIEWVKVIKSVYLRMKNHGYEEFEPEYMERAKKYLYSEIAVRFDISMDEAEGFVCRYVDNCLKEF